MAPELIRGDTGGLANEEYLPILLCLRNNSFVDLKLQTVFSKAHKKTGFYLICSYLIPDCKQGYRELVHIMLLAIQK